MEAQNRAPLHDGKTMTRRGLLIGLLVAASLGALLVRAQQSRPRAPTPTGQPHAALLCCCNTQRGQCCGKVSICGRSVPGCLCSDHFAGLHFAGLLDTVD